MVCELGWVCGLSWVQQDYSLRLQLLQLQVPYNHDLLVNIQA